MNPVLGWLLNGHGASGAYSVYRLTADGLASNPTQVIAPGGGFTSIFWPSGVQVGEKTHIYATALDASGNSVLGLWTVSGGLISFEGIVLSAAAGEGQIGSASVLHDSDDISAPFKMLLATNYTSRPTVVKYLTSGDGLNWTRRGVVLSIGEGYETEGFQIDFFCLDNGVWRLLYTPTNDAMNVFRGAEAASSHPGSLFAKRGVVLSPVNGGASVTNTLPLGTRYLAVGSTAALVEGHVYVLSNGTATGTQRAVIERVLSPTEVIVADPVHVSGAGFTLKATDASKVCVSSIFYDQHGVGRGLATGWGANPAVGCEYVFEVDETATGFVRRPNAALGFKPFGPGSQNSFENPSPILAGPGRPVWAAA